MQILNFGWVYAIATMLLNYIIHLRFKHFCVFNY